MNGSVPSIGRVTFVAHFVVALIVGLGLLLVPDYFGGLLGWGATPSPLELDPVLRAFGALVLGMGALTSFYGMLTKSWARVDYIVRGEITYLVLGTLVFLISALLGRGPAVGNWVFTVVCLVLLVLFVLTWMARPKK